MHHDLTDDHAVLLYEEQGGCCAVSDLRFSLSRFPNVLVKHPFAPSLDRKRASGGYTSDNVRLVCIAINFGMGQWGEELYLIFARAAVEHEQRTRQFPPEGCDALTAVDWSARQRERISAAEAIAATLSGDALKRQLHRVAGLKSALTKGQAGIGFAGMKAAQSRKPR